MIDVLQISNWQRAGVKNARRPEPIQRPGVRRQQRRSQLSEDEMRRRLLAFREERREG